MQTDDRPTTTYRNPRGRRWLAPALAAGALVIAAVVAIVVLTNDEGSDVLPAPTTVVPGQLELALAFDGETCEYTGPTRATLDDQLNLSIVNSSPEHVVVQLVLLPDERPELLELIGSDVAGEPSIELKPTFFVEAEPQSEASIASYVAAPGTFAVVCTTRDAGAVKHAWWSAAVDMRR